MVARTEVDWEDRMWWLMHDLVVAKSVAERPAVVGEREMVADCMVLASTAMAVYRAVLERNVEEI